MSKVFDLIKKEAHRQKFGLEMIPSENYVSENVLKALGSILTNKYSEGFPGRRYYGGNEIIDDIERYTQNLANKLFNTKYAIVQPYSGSPANLAIYTALLKPGEIAMGMALFMGGHLTHGAPASFTGQTYKVVQYGVENDGKINLEKVRELALESKPKIIWIGATAYPFIFDFKGFGEIAKEIGAYLIADIAHVAGLIIGGSHPSPEHFADIITTTTHKTLRGPRGAMVLITEKGLKKDPELAQKVEKAVFPGLQGGPHNHQTAAIAVSLEEASTKGFKKYAEQIVVNAKVLAETLKKTGIKVIGTDNHMMLIDLTAHGFGMGYQAQYALELAGITVNRNTIPGESASPFYPSGIRLGSPALTTRGMNEKDMIKIAGWIKQVLEEIRGLDLPKEQEKRKDFLRDVKKKLKANKNLKKIRKEVETFAGKFPVPGIDI